MSALGPPPSKTLLIDPTGMNNAAWVEYFSTLYFTVISLQQRGTTAQRPVKGVYIGRPFFDTTLVKPIWYTGSNWILADGTVA